MIKSVIKTTIEKCTRWPWLVLAVSVVLAGLAGLYTVQHFAINTDISKLISPSLPWRQRELAFNKAFPQSTNIILAVIDAPTSEAASKATLSLSHALEGRKNLFRAVDPVSETPFFAHSAFLFLPVDQVAAITGRLGNAAPLIGQMARDPSLRGLSRALQFGVMGIAGEGGSLDPLAPVLNEASSTIDTVLADKPPAFSWRAVLAGQPPSTTDTRRFIVIHPVLDFAALEPGKKASDAVRRTVADLHLKQDLGATVRLTGSVPISDEEFRTIQEGAIPNAIATIVVVLIILWLALRSAKIIVAVFITVAIGLAITAALGLMMVGALNMISVAFFVLFVGIGVDFGIQFSVRYRAERHAIDDLHRALVDTAEHISTPLALAAAATAAGFLSFVPTAYRGVSELGQIAGLGMIIAFVTSVTVLPALLTIFNPAGEPEPLGYAALAPVDRFMERYRMPILIGTAVVIVLASPLLYFLQFDFNPIDLRNPNAESITTYLDVSHDPAAGANAVDHLAPSLSAARVDAARLAKLPEVARAMTLDSFVPADQPRKIALIEAAAKELLPALDAPQAPAPTDAENIAALQTAQQALARAAQGRDDAGAKAAKRLAADLGQLAAAGPPVRAKAQAAFITPLKTALDGLRQALQPQPVTETNLPATIRRQWITPDGRARVEVLPKGELNTNAEIRKFAGAVLKVEPTRHRRADLDPGIRRHHHPRLLRGGPVGADLDRHPAVADAAPHRRRAAHPHSALGRRRGDARIGGGLWACRSTSPTSSRCRCCSASASPSRSIT